MSGQPALQPLLRAVRACRLCEAELPLGARPTVQMGAGARLLIVGQAPGSKVHQSGIPWSDASGTRLRQWLQLDTGVFYDPARVAIVPMGLCYPGRDAGAAGAGDLPPRPECAPHWHPRLLGALPRIRLTLLLGQYAQRYYLGPRRKASLTETVRAYAEYAPRFFPLPHPSWRSGIWMRGRPWFEAEVLPALRAAVAQLL
ncbi:MAG: uracil-DNA glycosylase family protein [Steroidobacteraceae bacterium]